MFHSARIKLTLWYLFIITAISISFSAVIYFGATREVDRAIRAQQYRIEHPELRIIQRPPWEFDNFPSPSRPDAQIVAAEAVRILESLIVVNIFIFIASFLAGYFLAGRTLKPIKDMMDEQNRFVTDASHELNTPLTSLKTSIEVNLRDKKFNFKKAKDVLISNLEEVNNLNLLSNDLIKLTQFEKPNGTFQFEKVSLQEVINKAFEKIKPMSLEKNIKINLSIPEVYVKGDSRSLTEVFVIFLDNAVKYSNQDKQITIKAKKTDSKIQISVSDKGIGIGKNDLEHIFDRFYRIDKSRTKQQIPGYGLGLSIAKRVILLHNGNIRVESRVGKGTSFIINLPLA